LVIAVEGQAVGGGAKLERKGPEGERPSGRAIWEFRRCAGER